MFWLLAFGAALFGAGVWLLRAYQRGTSRDIHMASPPDEHGHTISGAVAQLQRDGVPGWLWRIGTRPPGLHGVQLQEQHSLIRHGRSWRVRSIRWMPGPWSPPSDEHDACIRFSAAVRQIWREHPLRAEQPPPPSRAEMMAYCKRRREALLGAAAGHRRDWTESDLRQGRRQIQRTRRRPWPSDEDEVRIDDPPVVRGILWLVLAFGVPGMLWTTWRYGVDPDAWFLWVGLLAMGLLSALPTRAVLIRGRHVAVGGPMDFGWDVIDLRDVRDLALAAGSALYADMVILEMRSGGHVRLPVPERGRKAEASLLFYEVLRKQASGAGV